MSLRYRTLRLSAAYICRATFGDLGFACQHSYTGRMDQEPKSTRNSGRSPALVRRTDIAIAIALTLMAAGFLLGSLVTS